jgi:hypothetical protein
MDMMRRPEEKKEIEQEKKKEKHSGDYFVGIALSLSSRFFF